MLPEEGKGRRSRMRGAAESLEALLQLIAARIATNRIATEENDDCSVAAVSHAITNDRPA